MRRYVASSKSVIMSSVVPNIDDIMNGLDMDALDSVEETIENSLRYSLLQFDGYEVDASYRRNRSTLTIRIRSSEGSSPIPWMATIQWKGINIQHWFESNVDYRDISIDTANDIRNIADWVDQLSRIDWFELIDSSMKRVVGGEVV